MITIKNAPLPAHQYNTKAPYAMKPVGVTIHETDNEASAVNEIAYMQRNTNRVSFHYAVDNKDIIQGLPLDRNGWHAGDGTNGKGNRTTLAIEICGNYRRSGSVGQPTAWYYDARKNAEMLTGYLLWKYNWTDKNIHTHYDWIGKNCPRVILREKYMNQFKKNAMAWKKKFADAAKPKPSTPAPKPPTSFKVGDKVEYDGYLYRNSTGGGKGSKRKGTFTITILNKNSHGAHLDKLGWVKPSDLKKVSSAGNAVAKDKVKIKKGAKYRSLAKAYDGRAVGKDYVGKEYDYELNRVKGKDWVYITQLHSYVGANDVEFTKKGAAPAPSKPVAKPKPIKKGSKVQVVKAIQFDNGRPFGVHHKSYDVLEVNGNRVVIGIGKTVTAAVHANNLKVL